MNSAENERDEAMTRAFDAATARAGIVVPAERRPGSLRAYGDLVDAMRLIRRDRDDRRA